jgi:hypothetical protein
VSKVFPTDFYVTCATVIPVFYLALVVQGGTYGSMLKAARQAAKTLPQRSRDYAAAEILPVAAWFTLAAAALGEGASLFALYAGSEQPETRPIVLICTLILLFAVTALPAWNYLQTTGAVVRQRQGEKRPLWTARDRNAEKIRIILRDAGHKEYSERHDGFVVEGGDSGEPFLVACTGIDEAWIGRKTVAYIRSLKLAGFEVKQDPDDSGILQVRLNADSGSE